MALNQRLELRQGQSLVMTPQLQQAIKLLQMSNMELQAFVDQELERNPLLERDERSEVQKERPEAADAPARHGERARGPTPAPRSGCAPSIPNSRMSTPTRRAPTPTNRRRAGRRRIRLVLAQAAGGALAQRRRQRLRRHADAAADTCRAPDGADEPAARRALRPADRPAPDRHAERGRLPVRRARRRWRRRSAPRSPMWRPCWPGSGLRPGRRLRARPQGMPQPAAEGARPLRSRHGDARRQSRARWRGAISPRSRACAASTSTTSRT